MSPIQFSVGNNTKNLRAWRRSGIDCSDEKPDACLDQAVFNNYDHWVKDKGKDSTGIKEFSEGFVKSKVNPVVVYEMGGLKGYLPSLQTYPNPDTYCSSDYPYTGSCDQLSALAHSIVDPINKDTNLKGLQFDIEAFPASPKAIELYKRVADLLAFHGKLFQNYAFADAMHPDLMMAMGPMGVVIPSTYDVGGPLVKDSPVYSYFKDHSDGCHPGDDQINVNSYCNLGYATTLDSNKNRLGGASHTYHFAKMMRVFGGHFQMGVPAGASAMNWQAVKVVSSVKGFISLKCAEKNCVAASVANNTATTAPVDPLYYGVAQGSVAYPCQSDDVTKLLTPGTAAKSKDGLKLSDGRYCAVFFGLDDTQSPPFVGVNSSASYPTQAGYLNQIIGALNQLDEKGVYTYDPSKDKSPYNLGLALYSLQDNVCSLKMGSKNDHCQVPDGFSNDDAVISCVSTYISTGDLSACPQAPSVDPAGGRLQSVTY